MLEFLKNCFYSSKAIFRSIQDKEKKIKKGLNKNDKGDLSVTSRVDRLSFTDQKGSINNSNEESFDSGHNMFKKIIKKSNEEKEQTFLMDYSEFIPRVAIVFVVDITNEQSFNDALSFLKKLREFEKLELYKTDKIVLLNKYDKLADGKTISGINLKLEPFGVNYFYCSAKNGWNIHTSINEIVTQLRKKYYPSNH